jgi:hypothetical protein
MIEPGILRHNWALPSTFRTPLSKARSFHLMRRRIGHSLQTFELIAKAAPPRWHGRSWQGQASSHGLGIHDEAEGAPERGLGGETFRGEPKTKGVSDMVLACFNHTLLGITSQGSGRISQFAKFQLGIACAVTFAIGYLLAKGREPAA